MAVNGIRIVHLPDFLLNEKSPDFSVETSLFFISTIIKRWFQPFGLHTRSLTNCFVCNFLSSASVLGSGYSASALPFLLFPVPPRSCFPGARLRSRFLGFPLLSGLISHAFLPGSCTRLRCSFPFALPCFAPTAVPQVLTFRFHFRYFPLPVRFQLLSLLHFLSPSAVSPHSGYLSTSTFFLAASALFPLAFTLGSGYSA